MNFWIASVRRHRIFGFLGVMLTLTGCILEEPSDAILDDSDEEPSVALATGPHTATAQPIQATGPARIPLVTFYSPGRDDYFTTSQSGWTCKYFRTCPGAPDGDYRAIGLQGHVYNPSNPRPTGTVPLYHWWSAHRGDNFLTTDPAWAGNIGDRRRYRGTEYVLFRIEGYVRSASGAGSFPLRSYWNPTVADNAAVAAWRSGIPAGYSYYRTEGYLLSPESDALSACLADATPNHRDNPSWQARGNYIDTWPAASGFFHGDAIRITAPADRYRIDYWGHQKLVRGDAGSSAPGSFPARGEPKYALLGRVTRGRIFLRGRGWYEANTWFQALGDEGDSPGRCMLYDATGVSEGDLKLGFNDDNVGDNGGWANVTVKQWFQP